MKCPQCHHDDSKVLESRQSTDHHQIRRRRQCLNCGYRFTTYEKTEEVLTYVRKRDDSVEPYLHSKALRSIHIACQRRPITLSQMEALLYKVERRFAHLGEPLVSSHHLGQAILEELRRRDAIAYIRFASVYMDFKDPSEFTQILSSLLPSCSDSKASECSTRVTPPSTPPSSTYSDPRGTYPPTTDLSSAPTLTPS